MKEENIEALIDRKNDMIKEELNSMSMTDIIDLLSTRRYYEVRSSIIEEIVSKGWYSLE